MKKKMEASQGQEQFPESLSLRGAGLAAESCSRSVIDCSKTYILGKELRNKVVRSEKDCQKTNKQIR